MLLACFKSLISSLPCEAPKGLSEAKGEGAELTLEEVLAQGDSEEEEHREALAVGVDELLAMASDSSEEALKPSEPERHARLGRSARKGGLVVEHATNVMYVI